MGTPAKMAAASRTTKKMTRLMLPRPAKTGFSKVSAAPIRSVSATASTICRAEATRASRTSAIRIISAAHTGSAEARHAADMPSAGVVMKVSPSANL